VPVQQYGTVVDTDARSRLIIVGGPTDRPDDCVPLACLFASGDALCFSVIAIDLQLNLTRRHWRFYHSKSGGMLGQHKDRGAKTSVSV